MDKQPKTVESYIKKAECPLCGASLVVRTGPNGKFWGCSIIHWNNLFVNTEYLCLFVSSTLKTIHV
jgi:hypothetical protein